MRKLLSIVLFAITFHAVPAVAQSAEELRAPFSILRDAYARKDATAAAQAYTRDAKIVFQYPGMPREEHVGTAAITATIVRVLQPIRPEWTIDMNFKLEPASGAGSPRTGLYRIAVNIGAKTVNSYGRFTVRFGMEDGVWRFSEDISDIATQADYDSAPQPEMFAG
jgi:ketosteroid isomerase-like protein